jgi:dTDP-glucose 4,6-dehydratase
MHLSGFARPALTVQWYLDNQDWVSNVQSGAYRAWVGKNYADRT